MTTVDYYIILLAETPPGTHIKHHVALAPKTYGGVCSDGSTYLKAKGFTLSHEAAQLLDIQVLEELVKNERPSIDLPSHTIQNKAGRLHNIDATKTLRNTMKKRYLGPENRTFPFGY